MRYALTAYVARWVVLLALVLTLWLLGIHKIGFALAALLAEAVLLATLIPLWRRGAVGARDLGLRLVPGARATGLVIMGLIAYGSFSVFWTRALHLAPIPRSNFTGISHQSTSAIVLAGFVACVGAPVAEEIFFRGFLYRSLRNRFGIVVACLLSSMLFGLDHTQYPLIVRPVLVFFGVVTCLLYERTGSLVPGIALHSFVDGSGFERSLTGNASVVGSLYLLVAVILLARPPLKGLGRLLTRRPLFSDYPMPEEDAAESSELSLQKETPLVASDPADPFGTTGRRSRTGRFAGVLGALLALFLLLSLSRPSLRSQLHNGSSYPYCVAAGIDSAEGHEGTCVEGPPTSLTTVNVVDHARLLRMPEYDARLLESQIVPTRVTNASEHESLYPRGAGELVSYKLSITNTTGRPLQFGVGTGYRRRASYAPNPDVELALPESPESRSELVTTYPPIIEGRGAPTPSILQQPPIEPNETRTGWVSFIAPASTLSILGKPGADIDFHKVNGDKHYRGSIRLWK